MRRPVRPAAAGPLSMAVAVGILGACSADAQDFQEQAAAFIESDEVSERFAGVEMSEAECDRPADTNEATRYLCTATGSDGSTWRFTIEITGSESLSIVAVDTIPPGATPGSLAEPSGPTTTPPPATTTSTAPATPTTGAGATAPTTTSTSAP